MPSALSSSLMTAIWPAISFSVASPFLMMPPCIAFFWKNTSKECVQSHKPSDLREKNILLIYDNTDHHRPDTMTSIWPASTTLMVVICWSLMPDELEEARIDRRDLQLLVPLAILRRINSDSRGTPNFLDWCEQSTYNGAKAFEHHFDTRNPNSNLDPLLESFHCKALIFSKAHCRKLISTRNNADWRSNQQHPVLDRRYAKVCAERTNTSSLQTTSDPDKPEELSGWKEQTYLSILALFFSVKASWSCPWKRLPGLRNHTDVENIFQVCQ